MAIVILGVVVQGCGGEGTVVPEPVALHAFKDTICMTISQLVTPHTIQRCYMHDSDPIDAIR